MNEMVEHVARAVREEIVRQYREDERGKCPAGANFYEEYIGPAKISRVAIDAMRTPTDAMRTVIRTMITDERGNWVSDEECDARITWLIDAALD